MKQEPKPEREETPMEKEARERFIAKPIKDSLLELEAENAMLEKALTRCRADDIMNPLVVDERIRQSAKESRRAPCPKCGGWMLQPINEESSFCIECGTYSTGAGRIVLEESLIASGDIIVREKTAGRK